MYATRLKSKNPIISGTLIIAGLCCATILRAKEEDTNRAGMTLEDFEWIAKQSKGRCNQFAYSE